MAATRSPGARRCPSGALRTTPPTSLPGHERQRRLELVLAARLQDLGERHAGGVHVDDHRRSPGASMCARLGLGQVDELQRAVGPAQLGDLDGAHARNLVARRERRGSSLRGGQVARPTSRSTSACDGESAPRPHAAREWCARRTGADARCLRRRRRVRAERRDGCDDDPLRRTSGCGPGAVLAPVVGDDRRRCASAPEQSPCERAAALRGSRRHGVRTRRTPGRGPADGSQSARARAPGPGDRALDDPA